ncbi:MAG: biotin--[acetyl-CoA-carboxylase] ligase [Candidatus Omnitrophota bacterium]
MEEKNTDLLLAKELSLELNTRIIGKKILSYNIVDSTSAIAAALAEKNEPEGTVIFAEGQKKGKGRLGRNWVSPSAQGIYCSLILRPKIPTEEALLLTLMAGVSCCKAIRQTYGINALIKWPNDIIINNKKVCGILTEMQTRRGQVDFVILGVGINVSTPVNMLPEGATSLQEETGKHFSRVTLAGSLLRGLETHYLEFMRTGGKNILAQWKNFSALCGKSVKVIRADHITIKGTAGDIDEKGALIVRTDNGVNQHLLATEVIKVY